MLFYLQTPDLETKLMVEETWQTGKSDTRLLPKELEEWTLEMPNPKATFFMTQLLKLGTQVLSLLTHGLKIRPTRTNLLLAFWNIFSECHLEMQGGGEMSE